MRARRYRPSFDVMDRRITPSDVLVSGVCTSTTCYEQKRDVPELPGDSNDVVTKLDGWIVGGNPPEVVATLPGEGGDVVGTLDGSVVAGH